MAAIRFCEKAKVAALVLGELSVESLEQRPDIWSSGDGASDFVVTVREPGTNRLVHIQHVGITVPAVGIKGWRAGTVDEMARTIFLEQTNHTTAARTSIEPSCERRCCGVASSLKEPEPPRPIEQERFSRRLGCVHVHVCAYGQVP